MSRRIPLVVLGAVVLAFGGFAAVVGSSSPSFSAPGTCLPAAPSPSPRRPEPWCPR
jgi:hypothetical protein